MCPGNFASKKKNHEYLAGRGNQWERVLILAKRVGCAPHCYHWCMVGAFLFWEFVSKLYILSLCRGHCSNILHEKELFSQPTVSPYQGKGRYSMATLRMFDAFCTPTSSWEKWTVGGQKGGQVSYFESWLPSMVILHALITFVGHFELYFQQWIWDS